MRSLALLLVLMLLSPCFAGYAYEPCKYVVRVNEIIRGRVVDDQTGEPAVASVVLENLMNLENGEPLENMKTETDSDGKFSFVLPWGDFRFSLGVSPTLPGYYDWSENGWIKKGERREVEIRVRYYPFHVYLSENSGAIRKRWGERWGSRTLTITVEPRNRYFGQVEFSIRSQGISASFRPPVLLLSSHTTCQLTLLPSESLGEGDYEIQILARDNRGRLVENVPYTLSLSIEPGGGGGGGRGWVESKEVRVSIPINIFNKRTGRTIPTVQMEADRRDVQISSFSSSIGGGASISSPSQGQVYFVLSKTVIKGDPPLTGSFTATIRVDTPGYYPGELTISGNVSASWEGMTCDLASAGLPLDPKEGWVQLSWSKTPKLILRPGAPSDTVSLSASGDYQWDSNYWLKYYSDFGTYGQVDEYWDGQKRNPPALLAKTKTPWGGTYKATATGWVTDSGGNIVTMMLRSNFVDASGEVWVVPAGQERPVNMYASIGGPQVWQDKQTRPA